MIDHVATLALRNARPVLLLRLPDPVQAALLLLEQAGQERTACRAIYMKIAIYITDRRDDVLLCARA